MLGLQVPVRRDRVEVDVADLCAAIHLPQNGRATVVAPDQVRLTVALEVTVALDVELASALDVAVALEVPVGRDRVEIDVTDLGRAVHLPQYGRAVVVAPDDVRLVVAVEITQALDVPVGRDDIEVDVGELGR